MFMSNFKMRNFLRKHKEIQALQYLPLINKIKIIKTGTYIKVE